MVSTANLHHYIKALNFLKISGFKYAISTTSPKPRVPVCVDTASLRDWFPEDKIHSGESDFDPPRFKPDPAVRRCRLTSG